MRGGPRDGADGGTMDGSASWMMPRALPPPPRPSAPAVGDAGRAGRYDFAAGARAHESGAANEGRIDVWHGR